MIKEESPSNSVGGIAGLGVVNDEKPDQHEPGVQLKRKKRIMPFKLFLRALLNDRKNTVPD